MNERLSNTGFGMKFQLAWFKSRPSRLQFSWLEIEGENRLKSIIYLRNLNTNEWCSGAVVQALVWITCWSELNLCEYYCNHFKLSNEETNWLKWKIYFRMLIMNERVAQ